MTPAEEFEELRALLFSIAYRILGSVTEAEDAVQETWLRYESSPTKPASTKAFLSAVVTRVSIDVLRSARVRREKYVRQWFPEPLLTDPYEDPARSAELADSVSMAALVERDHDHLRAIGSQLVGSCPSSTFVTRAEEDGPTLLSEPPGRLKTKSLLPPVINTKVCSEFVMPPRRDAAVGCDTCEPLHHSARGELRTG